MIILRNYWILIIFIIALIAIAVALIAENFFDMLPCEMCLYQRYTYYILIILSMIFLLLKKYNSQTFYLLAELILIIGLIISLWHFGIENSWLQGPSGCSSSIANMSGISELRQQILNAPIINCNEINWSVLGISITVYNAILQFVLLSINTIYLFKKNA
tara:strand:+ start:5714 stop:6193 length:480 start_codon:yes stop_codon:yes gene_type:complete